MERISILRRELEEAKNLKYKKLSFEIISRIREGIEKEHECKDIIQDIREIRKKSFACREMIEMEALMDDVDKSMRDLKLKIDSKT